MAPQAFRIAVAAPTNRTRPIAMDIDTLLDLGGRVGGKIAARGETLAVAESSAGGLVSAALLSRAGASAYFFGAVVLYTRRSRRLLTELSSADTLGMRSSSPPFAQLLARHQRTRFRASWGLAESGAAGPSGNAYGDPAGHTCLAVDGPVLRQRMLRTGSSDRPGNMLAFAMAALQLLEDAVDAAPAPVPADG
jgi:PncC family amidohydrolase